MKILICDDDIRFAQQLCSQVRTVLQALNKSAQIHTVQWAEEIPDTLLENCDIAFLDIDFTGKNYTGIDIARHLRTKQKNAVIIFVTNFPEYAPEGYEVHAFRYLLKSAVGAKLPVYLAQALEQMESTGQTLQINLSGDTVRIPVENIAYIESQLHEVALFLLNGGKDPAYRFYASISTLEETLAPQGFLRIHKSYLVNMRHIQKYQCKEAVLTDGTMLRVSEKNYAQQKKQYLLWKGR